MALTDNIVSYYKLDAGSGSTVADAVGSNTGTWQGTLGSQWGTGKINGDGVFNGTDNYVGMGNVLDQTGATAFSTSCWIKFTAGGANVYTILGKVLFAPPYTGFQVGVNVGTGLIGDAGKLGVAVVTSTTEVARRTTTAAYNDGNWHHFVVTYDGSKTRAGLLIYVDTVQPTYVDFDSASWTNTMSTSANFEVGARDGANQTFPGQVDEVGIWSKALSQSEVNQLYNSGSGLQYPFTTTAANNTGGAFGQHLITLDGMSSVGAIH